MKRILLTIFTFTLLIKIPIMQAQEKETKILIETSLGDITIKLYNDTPLHRDNFIKLEQDGTYDGLLFHRVIKDFMIQGGDTSSKDAPLNTQLGEGDLGYTVPAEFIYPKLFHKKGALSAARTGDDVNPEKESSASQFYIVTGKIFTSQELDMMEKNRFERLKQSIINRLQSDNKEKVKELYKTGDRAKLTEFREQIVAEAETEAKNRQAEALFTEEQRNIYTTIGGTPHLDGSYTVYGEVTDGMDVVDKIQNQETNYNDRPLTNISMKMRIIE
ncbi:peptidylprolyl isomerase [Dysgonomonas sp. 520]|uniref:peptidylprolyl isomerase n=1 Tax=Dysgonomonas sp. 520 TaxID=2302931 RepID=UPI0013D1BD07|nr:peptidylprolyl isomerase [Dysgonomonas sp. 520]NDW09377.1 peptidylprolyl isomerase [Dysgonomonas sp. 520]